LNCQKSKLPNIAEISDYRPKLPVQKVFSLDFLAIVNSGNCLLLNRSQPTEAASIH
jgi:hypothetical protein